MGILKALRIAEASAVLPVEVGTASRPTGDEATVKSLDPVAARAFGLDPSTCRVTREVAMRVPAVRRGRALIAGTIGTLPLGAARTDSDGSVTPVRRTLLEQLDPRTTPAYTITWTVDDLIFYPCSWWRVTGRDAEDFPSSVEHLAWSRVRVDVQKGAVYVDNVKQNDRDIIRIDGPDEGLITYGSDTVRLALALANAARRVADDDWSGLVLALAEGADELSTEPGSANPADPTDTRSEVDALLDGWESARQARSTAYLNRAIELQNVASNAQQRQLTELQQLVSSELARLLNLPASRIGAPAGSSMTYTNTESDRRDLVDTTLAPYLTAIAQRLSMPDVTPRGQAVRFDLTAYLRGTLTELVTAGKLATEAGFTDRLEVRTRWLGLPPADIPAPATPAPTSSEEA